MCTCSDGAESNKLPDSGKCIGKLLEQGWPSAAKPRQSPALEVITVEQVRYSLRRLGDAEARELPVDGIDRQIAASEVGPDIVV